LKHSLAERREPRWRRGAVISRRVLPPPLISWLLQTPSLTQRLKQDCCGGFRVRLLSQNWQRPMRNECIALGMRHHEFGLVRQVHLLCHQRPWVFARTVIPIDTATGAERRLTRLGTRPLGALLFADRTVRRDELEIASIGPGDALYAVATGAHDGAAVWGRRSVFRIADKPLLVSEIFLAGLGEAEPRR